MQYVTQMNQYLSNLALMIVKLHNVHWNVVGPQFMQVHEFTESLYDDVFEQYDEIAELIKMKGYEPLVTMKDYLANATLEESALTKFTSKEVYTILRSDLEAMRTLATEIRNAADEAGDFETVAEFEEHVAGYTKHLGFIGATLDGNC
jgi:starvation-inducible DNA-binding protein